MQRVAEFAALNANYLSAELRKAGFELAFPERRASHEFIVTLKKLKDDTGISAMDFAKRLLDYGFHAPTTYFPMLVPECLLIEPTETETAIETNVDRVGLEHHELSGRAKDIASAAVFLVIVFAASVWALILVPRWL
jgi:glycine cleavage system protein P-like pyridoxal-binding family